MDSLTRIRTALALEKPDRPPFTWWGHTFVEEWEPKELAASGLAQFPVVVGGVNIFGGSGTIFGAVLGAIVLGTLQNALNILNISQFWLQAIYGAAIIGAVVLDAFITRWLQRAILSGRKKA